MRKRVFVLLFLSRQRIRSQWYRQAGLPHIHPRLRLRVARNVASQCEAIRIFLNLVSIGFIDTRRYLFCVIKKKHALACSKIHGRWGAGSRRRIRVFLDGEIESSDDTCIFTQSFVRRCNFRVCVRVRALALKRRWSSSRFPRCPYICSQIPLGCRACAAPGEVRRWGSRAATGVGKMRVTGDVLVRRSRGGQRQVHPPRRRPGGVHARRRGPLSKTGERS